MNTMTSKPLFSPGPIVATPAILEAFPMTPPAPGAQHPFLFRCLDRHLDGDWGDLCDEDKEANDMSLIEGTRILSAYKIPDGIHTPTGRDGKIYIITEAADEGSGDPFARLYTTLLFPSEY